MKLESFHSLLTAKTIFSDAERLCRSANEHETSAGVVMLQDSVELFFLACALEKTPDSEDFKLEKSAFPELLAHVRKAGITVAKSGVLSAMNKTRVVVKHYGQVCAPQAAMTYLGAAKIAIDVAIREVFGLSLSEVFSTALLADGPGKSYLQNAVRYFDAGEFANAQVAVRQALFVEFEQDYYVGDYAANPPLPFVFRGHKAPEPYKSREWAASRSDLTELLAIDFDKLRFDLLEMGINTQEFFNVRNITPMAIEYRTGEWRLALNDYFAPWEATKDTTQYCIDQAVGFIIKKQVFAKSLKFFVDPPEGKRYKRIVTKECNVYTAASLSSQVALTLAAGTEIIYMGMCASFNDNIYFTKVWLSPSENDGNAGIAYIPHDATAYELVDVQTQEAPVIGEVPPLLNE